MDNVHATMTIMVSTSLSLWHERDHDCDHVTFDHVTCTM